MQHSCRKLMISRCNRLLAAGGLVIALCGHLQAQTEGPHWQRSAAPPEVAPVVFHSNCVINLPTAETWQKGMFQFEISHRFVIPLSSGYETFYGLDGHANIRLGMGWAPTSRTTVTLARSNLDGNVDLQLKWKAFHGRVLGRPAAVAFLAGAAWNTNSPMYESFHYRTWQFYAQAPVNARFGKLAVGAVTSYIYNSIQESADVEHSLTVGLYAQYYLSSLMSLMTEWNLIEPGYYYTHHPMAFGIELETGGHFFKIVFTNTDRLNASQYLPGTTDDASPDHWRLGFNITRLMRF